ncbi:efflux RND transporter permease subunit, partial [Pseudomonas sp. CCI4.2]|nr:efflux RND transporter permease subunit [Pseudomonas sp. CCI4.2]
MTIIGLSANNAILIIEGAHTLDLQAASIRQAVLDPARKPLRPNVKTSLAFIIAVLPLMMASGPPSASQRA